MQCHAPTARVVDAQPARRPPVEVADIFRRHGEAYRKQHAVVGRIARVMRDLVACRTEVLGGHLDVCSSCDFSRPAYNSCRNRHCPKCQSLSAARWLEKRKQTILPAHYFHVVFTVPEELKAIAWQNQARFYSMLFAAASATLIELGQDPKRLGGLLGVTAVLHTWTRTLAYHPHLHCIVTGGGLSTDGNRWLDCNPRFLFPVKVIGALFRGKMIAALRAAKARSLLHCSSDTSALADSDAFARMIASIEKRSWVVYAKPPFGGPEQVFAYLGRYTHRTGISNHRIISADDRAVRFHTKNGETCTLTPHEFIRRFLSHVLPRGLVKIRHFGLLAPSNVKTKLALARRLLLARTPAQPQPLPANTEEKPSDWRDLLCALTGVDARRCPNCAMPSIVRRPLPKFATGPPPS